MRHSLLARLATIFALAAGIDQELSPTDAYSDECALAYGETRNVGTLAQQSNPQAKFSEFGGEAASELLRMLAPGEDVLDLKVNRLLVMERPDIDEVRVAVVIGDCVVGIGKFNEMRWRNWRALTFGAGD